MAPRRHLAGAPAPSDRDALNEAVTRLSAAIDELQRPSTSRSRLPEPEHVHREHRLLPALASIDAWLRVVRGDHDTAGRCGWCDPDERQPCWAHAIARRLIGEP